MEILEHLFKFPILMVDGMMEEKKDILGLDIDKEVDIIKGVAECPYDDFVSITDRWIPNKDSFERAQNGEFDACFVIFGHSGSFVVPWNRERFKKKYIEFVSKIPVPNPVIEVSPEQMIELIKVKNAKKDEE